MLTALRSFFTVNLPLGGLSLVLIFLLLASRPALGSGMDKRPTWLKFVQLDWVGTGITICFATIISLAFQYGGVQKPWNSGSVIALLVMIPVSVSSSQSVSLLKQIVADFWCARCDSSESSSPGRFSSALSEPCSLCASSSAEP